MDVLQEIQSQRASLLDVDVLETPAPSIPWTSRTDSAQPPTHVEVRSVLLQMRPSSWPEDGGWCPSLSLLQEPRKQQPLTWPL